MLLASSGAARQRQTAQPRDLSGATTNRPALGRGVVDLQSISFLHKSTWANAAAASLGAPELFSRGLCVAVAVPQLVQGRYR